MRRSLKQNDDGSPRAYQQKKEIPKCGYQAALMSDFGAKNSNGQPKKIKINFEEGKKT